jgi:hypothetical protein
MRCLKLLLNRLHLILLMCVSPTFFIVFYLLFHVSFRMDQLPTLLKILLCSTPDSSCYEVSSSRTR